MKLKSARLLPVAEVQETENKPEAKKAEAKPSAKKVEPKPSARKPASQRWQVELIVRDSASQTVQRLPALLTIGSMRLSALRLLAIRLDGCYGGAIRL